MTSVTTRDFEREHQAATGDRKYSYGFDEVMRGYLVRTFAPHFRGRRGLELGCYRGDFTAHLLPHFADLTVADAARDVLDLTRSRYGARLRYELGTFETMALDGHYDAIFLVHVLEHVDDPLIVLSRVRDWLAPGGRLFLAVPNANAPSRQIAVRMGLISHQAAVTEAEYAMGHRRTYTLDVLERDARDAGLAVEARGGVFFKALANFQFDRLLAEEILSADYLEGCYDLGMIYPDLAASIYLVARRSQGG